MLAWWAAVKTPAIGYLVAWGLAVIVLGWKLAKAWQGSRADTMQQARAAALAAPFGTAAPAATAERNGNGADGRTVRAAEGARGHVSALGPRDRPAANADLPAITVEQAMAELDAMIGLEPVKDQIRQLTASVEAARRRAPARPRSHGSLPRSTTRSACCRAPPCSRHSGPTWWVSTSAPRRSRPTI
jgi:hypothetical protein